MVKLRNHRTGANTLNRARTAVLVALGLSLTLPTAPAVGWVQWYAQDTPYIPMWGTWLYQDFPAISTYGPAQPWSWYPFPGRGARLFQHYRSLPLQPTTLWSSTMRTSGLQVERNESPAGYMIRVYTGRPGAPAIDITAEGGFLTIRSRSMTGAVGGAPMQTRQVSWAAQWISLPVDANIAAMRMQRGNGVVEIFIPRRS